MYNQTYECVMAVGFLLLFLGGNKSVIFMPSSYLHSFDDFNVDFNPDKEYNDSLNSVRRRRRHFFIENSQGIFNDLYRNVEDLRSFLQFDLCDTLDMQTLEVWIGPKYSDVSKMCDTRLREFWQPVTRCTNDIQWRAFRCSTHKSRSRITQTSE